MKQPIRKKCMIFARVSSEKQVKGIEGNSIEQQFAVCTEYAKQLGFTTILHHEAKESAKEEGDGFKEMLRKVKKEKCDAIIVQYLDRFSRKTWITGKYVEELRSKGIYLHAVHERITSEREESLFYFNLYASFAQQDNQRRKERAVNSSRLKLMNGFWIHKPPVGYYRDKNTDTIKESADAPFIKAAFQMMINKSDIKAVKDAMELQGFKKSYKRWSEILRNRFYCGRMVSSYLEEYHERYNFYPKGNHIPLITEEEFNIVQSRLCNRGEAKTKEVNYEEEIALPLKVSLKCPCCGKGVTGYAKLKKDKKYYYYKCSNNCQYNVNANIINQNFLNTLSSCTIDQNLTGTLEIKAALLYDKVFSNELEKQKRLKSNISRLQNREDRLYEDYLDKRKSQEDYDRLSNEISKEIEKAQKALKGLKVVDKEMFIKKAMDMVGQVSELWKLANFEQKKRLQRLILKDGLTFNKEDKSFREFKIYNLYRPVVIP